MVCCSSFNIGLSDVFGSSIDFVETRAVLADSLERQCRLGCSSVLQVLTSGYRRFSFFYLLAVQKVSFGVFFWLSRCPSSHHGQRELFGGCRVLPSTIFAICDGSARYVDMFPRCACLADPKRLTLAIVETIRPQRPSFTNPCSCEMELNYASEPQT